MRSLAKFHGKAPHPAALDYRIAGPRLCPAPNPSPAAPNKGSWRVLCVGRLAQQSALDDALSHSPLISVSHAADYRDLWILSKGAPFDAVVFEPTVGSLELYESACLVRARWPSARIVLIRSGESPLDDPLYDQRLHPPADGNSLIACLSGMMRPTPDRVLPEGSLAHALGG